MAIKSVPKHRLDIPSERELAEKPKDRILAAAQCLFHQKGFAETSTQEIAKLAKVNKSTVFNRYQSKADLLFACLSSNMESLLKLNSPVLELDLSPGEKLELLVCNHIKWRSANIALVGTGDTLMHYLPAKLMSKYLKLRNQYERIFRKAIEEVMIAQQCRYIDSDIATKYVLGFLNSIIQWLKPNDRLSVDEIIFAANKFVAKALDGTNSQ